MLPEHFTAPERALWAAFPRGRWVDVRVGEPRADDPGTAANWGDERVVRAEVISALLLSAARAEPGEVAALRLRGARICGELNVASSKIGVVIHLNGCRLDRPPDLSGAATRTIRLDECDMDGFDGGSLRVDGDLRITRSRVHGRVKLNHSHISGSVHLGGTSVNNPGHLAVWGGGMTVDGGMFFRHQFCANGTVRLIGAHIGGGLFLETAQLRNPDGVALCLDDLTAPTVICTEGFAAHGEVQLQHAQIFGRVSFDGATLRASDIALRCPRLHADELCLTPRGMDGAADLGAAQIGTLRDDPASWAGRLWLDGLTYEDLRSSPNPADVATRLAWVRRGTGAYRPQPYEQLAAFYRRIGHDGDARRVLLVKQRARNATLHPYARAWGHLLDWTVGHGYRPWLAGIWLLVLLGAGTAIFTAHPPHPMDPNHSPHFNPLIYTMDLLVPISPFGMRNAFIPVGSSQWLAYALIIAGWILATAVVAGIARVLRRE